MSSQDTAPPRNLACKELVEIITDYFEGRLGADDRRRFDDHLVGCRGCRNYVDQMRETIRLTGNLAEDDVPAAGRDRLLAAFRDWKRQRAEAVSRQLGPVDRSVQTHDAQRPSR